MEFLNFFGGSFDTISILGNSKDFKTRLGKPNLTLMPPISTTSLLNALTAYRVLHKLIERK